MTTLVSKKISDTMTIRLLYRRKCGPSLFCVGVNVSASSKLAYATRRSVRLTSTATHGCNLSFRVISLRRTC